MTSDHCTVAIDVGNSALKLCVRKPESSHDSLIQHSIPIDESSWDDAAILWVREQVQCGRSHWRIASVHREAANRLNHAITGANMDASVRHITAADVPIEVKVDEPKKVGVDRLLGAYAAWNRYKRAVVVVDAGSAITVDWVCDEGRFQGGAILPGLTLQTRVLATGTDALPKVTWQTDQQTKDQNQDSSTHLTPAKNTSAAIRLGVLAGASAAIDRLAQSYQQSRINDHKSGRSKTKGLQNDDHRRDVGIVLTGGDAAIISPSLRSSHDVVHNLVCLGLLDLPAGAM